MQKEELNELLTKAKDLLKDETTKIAYETWIRDLDIESADNGNIVLIANNAFQKESILSRYHDLIKNTFNYITSRNCEITVILKDDVSEEELQVALDIVQKRKDCGVVYTKTNPDYTTNLTESNLLKQKCTYIGAATATDADQKFYSDEVKTPVGKYVLPFYAKGGVHEDSVTGRPELDAGKAYILAFLDNVAKGRAEWLAIAGATRGAIPGTYKVDGFLKEEEIDGMQLRTYDKDNLIAINPIVNMNPWGTRIWGNRTCLPNTNVTTDGEIATEDGGNVAASPTDQLVASSFANIRIVLCDIKKAIYKAARQYQFEQNTDVLWVNFTSSVNSLLEQMKSSYGIVGYRWKRDSANEQRGELRAILQITPIEACEDFTVTVELKDSLDNNVQIAE